MQGETRGVDTGEVTLAISPEKVCFIIVKAREFDAKDELTEPDPGSNPADDMEISVLEEHVDDPVVEELTSLSNGHNQKIASQRVGEFRSHQLRGSPRWIRRSPP